MIKLIKVMYWLLINLYSSAHDFIDDGLNLVELFKDNGFRLVLKFKFILYHCFGFLNQHVKSSHLFERGRIKDDFFIFVYECREFHAVLIDSGGGLRA
jgi:hypothetical protein